MTRIANRVLLTLTGLALFALGGGVLLSGLDLPRRWTFSLPAWWPFTGPHDVLLTTRERTRFRDDGWWWPTVIAVLGLLLLLLLWWLLAQLRRRRVPEVLVDTGDGETARLRRQALEHVMAAEAETLDGVSRAHAHLTGRRTAPAVRVRLLLDAHADPADTLTLLTRETLGAARDSVGLERLPATVLLRSARHQSRRAT